jgi:hypothetical protein
MVEYGEYNSTVSDPSKVTVILHHWLNQRLCSLETHIAPSPTVPGHEIRGYFYWTAEKEGTCHCAWFSFAIENFDAAAKKVDNWAKQPGWQLFRRRPGQWTHDIGIDNEDDFCQGSWEIVKDKMPETAKDFPKLRSGCKMMLHRGPAGKSRYASSIGRAVRSAKQRNSGFYRTMRRSRVCIAYRHRSGH